MGKTYTACLHKMGKDFEEPQIHIVKLEKIPGHFIDLTSVPEKLIVMDNEDDKYFIFHSENLENLFFINGEYVMYSFKKKREVFLRKIIKVEDSEDACINDKEFLNKCNKIFSDLISKVLKHDS